LISLRPFYFVSGTTGNGLTDKRDFFISGGKYMAKTFFYREKKERDYTVMCNTHLHDTRLSWRAIGIMSYLLALPTDWEIYISELEKHAKDGRDALLAGLRELKKYGYITVTRERNSNGTYKTIRYDIIECPQTDLPLMDKPEEVKPQMDLPQVDKPHVLNTDINKVPKVKNTKEEAPKEARELASLLYKLHKDFDNQYDVSDARLQSWANDINDIHRLDGRSWDDIKNIIAWCKQPSCFWFANIMSGRKLRDKFPRLFADMHKDKGIQQTAKTKAVW
jgi:hypothetical protein